MAEIKTEYLLTVTIEVEAPSQTIGAAPYGGRGPVYDIFQVL